MSAPLDPTAERDQLLAILRTLRPLLPSPLDVDLPSQRYALEAAAAILDRGKPAETPAPTFRLWDVVMNRAGISSRDGFPLEHQGALYADAIVASVEPLILISREGATKWENITQEQRRHLMVVKSATPLEAGPAYMRMRRELYENINQTGDHQ